MSLRRGNNVINKRWMEEIIIYSRVSLVERVIINKNGGKSIAEKGLNLLFKVRWEENIRSYRDLILILRVFVIKKIELFYSSNDVSCSIAINYSHFQRKRNFFI